MSFSIGQTVVYPHHGAALIEEVKTRTIKGEDRTYLMGRGYMPEGFDEALIGMEPGQTKEFTFEAPLGTENGEVVNKPISCTVTVKEIQQEVVPVIDDAWVKANMPMFASREALVAAKAAFRAALEGRQAVLLCPTTVLAEQHYQTFRARLAGFPVNVGLLSRFVTRPRQKEVLKAAATGQVDILIGTHRVLSSDVSCPIWPCSFWTKSSALVCDTRKSSRR